MNRTPSVLKRVGRQAACLVGLLAALPWSGSAFAATIGSPFVYAGVVTFHGHEDGDIDGQQAQSSTGSPVLVELTSPVTDAHGKARAQFGSLGFAFNSGSGGTAIWSDGFVINAGPAQGVASISISIDGRVEGRSADMSYSLFVSAKPFDASTILEAMEENDQVFPLPDATQVLHAEVFEGVGSPNLTLTGLIPFHQGETFYLASIFGGDVCYKAANSDDPDCAGGSEDFFHSAIFGIATPRGSELTTLSGTRYAAAVPEPETGALACAGLFAVMVAFGSRRRRSLADQQVHGAADSGRMAGRTSTRRSTLR